MKPADSTGLSGLLNPRRPPTGTPYGRDGFGSRLPTPYAVAAPLRRLQRPRAVDVAVRVAARPGAQRFALRRARDGHGDTGDPGPAAVGRGDDRERPGFFTPACACAGVRADPAARRRAARSASDLRGWVAARARPRTDHDGREAGRCAGGTGRARRRAVVAGSTAATGTEPKPATPPPPSDGEADDTGGRRSPGAGPSDKPSAEVAPEGGLWKPAKKPAAPKPKPVVDPTRRRSTAAEPKPAVATSPKPAIATTPKPAVATTPKPAAAAVKPAKKPTKVWVDPFAQ